MNLKTALTLNKHMMHYTGWRQLTLSQRLDLNTEIQPMISYSDFSLHNNVREIYF